MSEDLLPRLRARRDELIAGREQAQREALKQDFGFAAAIGELERLISDLEPPPSAPDAPAPVTADTLAELLDQSPEGAP